jgi:ferritin-like metal-binding protein YciE
MEKMINLRDLLKHEILDLYSAEEQIIEAVPAMIDKAQNSNLKKALQQHLKITEEQKKRLDKVKQLISEEEGQQTEGAGEEKKGFFSRLFGSSDEKEKCKGMEGLIDEGEKIMNEDISPEALDAAIIASAQKIEHYEISGYGTARAYAKELNLKEVERLLEQTLNEEYEADDRLTALAVGGLNIEAGKTTDTGSEKTGQRASSYSGNEMRQGGKETTEKSSSGKSETRETKPADEWRHAPSRTDSKKTSSSTKANTSKSEISSKKMTNKKSANRGSSAKAKKSSRGKSSTRNR